MYMGLHGSGWPNVLGTPRRTDLPLWNPKERTTDHGQGPNLRAGPRRALRVQRSRENENDPRPEETKPPKREEADLFIIFI